MPAKEIWFWEKTARLYGPTIKKAHKAQNDEKIVAKYIAAQGTVNVVSLGIGDGREIGWLKNLKNVGRIIGVDYSGAMLRECEKNAAKAGMKIDLVQDNLMAPIKLARIAAKERLPIFYICLLNTLGNFNAAGRVKILINIRQLMKRSDRLIICLYKKPGSVKQKIALPPQIILGAGADSGRLRLALEYARNEVLWSGIYERLGRLPRFGYERTTNDVAAYSGAKKIFFSHRFSRREIKGMCQFVNLEVENMVEGEFMWVAVLKTKKAF